MTVGKAGRKPTKPQKQCMGKCQRSRSEDQFYKYEGNDYADGLYPICKDCVTGTIDSNDLDAVKDQLVRLNRPFLPDLWEASVQEAEKRGTAVFGKYMKNIQLPKFRNLTWKDSENQEKHKAQKINLQSDGTASVELAPNIQFSLTTEMVQRWGANWEASDYIYLENFYHDMMNRNTIETPQEIAYLKKLATISLQMDKAIQVSEFGKVKQLGDLFSKFMADSKFRAMDKTEADKTGGIRNFSTIFAEVERTGHIPPWEQYRKIKNINQDVVDHTIMHIENFTLRLNKHERMIEPPEDTPQLNEINESLYDGSEGDTDDFS